MPRFFRRGRTPPTPDVPEKTAPSTAARGWSAELVARFEGIAREAVQPEDALEPALRALLEAVGIEVGALCLYDARRQLLRLAAESGLSDEGCRWMRTIRRGDPTTWEMPLHGLLNRRAYLIESAAHNRYVPRLVDGRAPMHTVACVPFYGAWDALGSVVLVSTGARALAERDIVALTRPLEELAKMVQAVREQVQGSSDTPPIPPPTGLHHPIDIVALNAEREALRAERESLRVELAEETDERGQLAGELAAVTADRDHRQAALDAALAERETLEADLERLRAQVGRVKELERLVAQLRADADHQGAARSAAEAGRFEHLDRVAALERERGELARRSDTLAGELEAARASMREAAAAGERRSAEQAAEMARLGKRLEEAALAGHGGRTSSEQYEQERARVGAELATARRRAEELETLTRAAASENRSTVQAAAEAARSADAARVAVEAELDSARARLRDATRSCDATTRRAQAAERDRDRLTAELAAVVARESDLRRELAAEVEARSPSRDAELNEARELAQAADSERARAVRAVAELGTNLDATRAELGRIEARLAEQEQEKDRLVLELRAATAREQALHAQLVGGESQRLAAVEEELARVRDTLRQAEAARGAAENEAVGARAARLKAETEASTATDEAARLGREAAAVRAERVRIDAALGEAWQTTESLRARLAADEQELGELRQLRDQLRATDQSHSAEEGSLRRQLEQIARDRDLVRATLETAEVERDRVRADLAATEAARSRLEAALGRETSERTRLMAALEGVRRDGAAPRGVERPGTSAAEGPRPIAVSAPLAPTSRPAPVRVAHLQRPGAPAVPEGTSRTIVVLDADEAWAQVNLEGRIVTRITPNAEAATELVALSPERIVVNIACPDALGTLLAARGMGFKNRFWGCLGASGSDRLLPLGMVEVASHPMDPEFLVEVLKGYVGRGGRVVTAGADVDGLMSLRQALARGGVGVNMAWDAKQVGDVLPVVRPTAVAVDLDLPRWDGFGIIATLSQIDPVPHALLLGGIEDASKAFSGLCAEARYQNRAISREQVLKGALGRSEQTLPAGRGAEPVAKPGARSTTPRRHAAGA